MAWSSTSRGSAGIKVQTRPGNMILPQLAAAEQQPYRAVRATASIAVVPENSSCFELLVLGPS